jgi:hypothetical protein
MEKGNHLQKIYHEVVFPCKMCKVGQKHLYAQHNLQCVSEKHHVVL